MSVSKQGERCNGLRPSEPRGLVARAGAASKGQQGDVQTSVAAVVAVAVVLGGVFAWAYWPTLVDVFTRWMNDPGYSHGFLVVPLAVLYLVVRRGEFPGWGSGFAWGGLAVIVASLLVRAAGALAFVDAVDGWSMLVWLAGVVWLLGGWRVLWWALPAIGFLFFMIPLPWSIEHGLSYPLQRVATIISCWVLQALGQPALGQGNVILLGDHELEVARACSGLLIFFGIFALCYAYLVLARPSWWERIVLVLAVIPVALVANATRVVGTALLTQYVSSEAAHRITHDTAGIVMIFYAAALFWLVLWYMGRLVREVEQVDVGTVVRRGEL